MFNFWFGYLMGSTPSKGGVPVDPGTLFPFLLKLLGAASFACFLLVYVAIPGECTNSDPYSRTLQPFEGLCEYRTVILVVLGVLASLGPILAILMQRPVQDAPEQDQEAK